MKKPNFKFKFRKVDLSELDDRTLLLNLYLTQAFTLLLGILIVFFQSRNVFDLFAWPADRSVWLWAVGFAAAAVVVDFLVSRWVPEEMMDDGGINEMIFRNRPLWHIALLSFVVAVCEELLFRGAVQHAFGPYWTSILFAAVHVRYLRHWLLTGLVFSISYGLGKLYMVTGTLWAPVAAHFAIDFIMGCFIRYRRGRSEDKS